MEIGLLIAFAIAAAGGIVIAYLIVDRQRARYKLDNYGRQPGARPLTSFVCPDCLHRSYAPQHIRDRFCPNCRKGFAVSAPSKEDA